MPEKPMINLTNQELDFIALHDDEVRLHFTSTTLVLSMEQYEGLVGEDDD